MCERDGLPVQQCIDHVGVQTPKGATPPVPRQILDVPEGQRPNRVEPVTCVRPEPEQPVAAFLEREDPFRVERELAAEDDREPVRRGRCTRPLAEASVVLDLVDRVADRRMVTQRMRDAVARPLWVPTP